MIRYSTQKPVNMIDNKWSPKFSTVNTNQQCSEWPDRPVPILLVYVITWCNDNKGQKPPLNQVGRKNNNEKTTIVVQQSDGPCKKQRDPASLW